MKKEQIKSQELFTNNTIRNRITQVLKPIVLASALVFTTANCSDKNVKKETTQVEDTQTTSNKENTKPYEENKITITNQEDDKIITINGVEIKNNEELRSFIRDLIDNSLYLEEQSLAKDKEIEKLNKKLEKANKKDTKHINQEIKKTKKEKREIKKKQIKNLTTQLKVNINQLRLINLFIKNNIILYQGDYQLDTLTQNTSEITSIEELKQRNEDMKKLLSIMNNIKNQPSINIKTLIFISSLFMAMLAIFLTPTIISKIRKWYFTK